MKKNPLLSLLLLIVVFGNVGFRAYSYRKDYQIPFDAEYWKQRYLRSQWVDPTSTEPIGDDGLYAYVGWEYIHGKDPTILNAQMPPLGKYLIGLSEVVFGNQNIFALISGIATLIALYKFSFLILSEPIWALLPVLGFSFEPLFLSQLKAPFLDNLYLFFLLLTFYFFLKEQFFLSSIFLGLFTATKSPFLSFVVLTSLLFVLVFTRDKQRLKKWFLSLPLSFLSFMLTYFRFFQLGGSFRKFFGVQRWIFNFYLSGARAPLGGILTLVLFNRQPLWWSAEIKKTSSFNISWPFFFLFYLFCLIFWTYQILKKKRFKIGSAKLAFLLLWPAFYLLFLFFIPVWPRYLLLLLPFWILLFTFYLKENFGKRPKEKLTRGFLQIFSFLRRNIFFFLVIFAIFLIRKLQSENFLFGARQGKDLLMIREIVYVHNFLPARGIIDLIFYYLSLPSFILTFGHPLATFFWTGFVFECFVLLWLLRLGQRLKIGSVLLLVYLLTALFINNLIFWRCEGLTPGKKDGQQGLLLKTELAVIDGIYQNLKVGERDFNFYVLNGDFRNEHYIYLFFWHGWSKYGYLPIWPGSGKAKIAYLIFEEERPQLLEKLGKEENLGTMEEAFRIETIKVERWRRK